MKTKQEILVEVLLRKLSTAKVGVIVSGVVDIDPIAAMNGIAKSSNCKYYVASVGYDIKTDDHSTLNTLANGGVYYTNGKSLDKLSTTVSAGFAADISENASLRFEYGGSYRKEYIEHSGMLRLEYKF